MAAKEKMQSTSRPEDIIAMRAESDQATKDPRAHGARGGKASGHATDDDQAATVATEPAQPAGVVTGELVPVADARDIAHRGPAFDREDSGELTPAQQATMDRLNAFLDARISPTINADAAVADIISQIMSADSVDEVLGDISATGLRDLVGVPLTVHGGKFNRSDYEAGAPFYVLLDVTRLDTGMRLNVTCGAQSVLAQIVRLIELDAFPLNLKCINARKSPSPSGYMPLRLTRI